MPRLILHSCCLCVDLRFGCFIIGFLNAVGSAVAFILAVIGVAAGVALTLSSDSDHEELGLILLSISIISLLAVVGLGAFSLFLLVGLHKNKPRLVSAYLIYTSVYLLLFFILFVVDTINGPFTWDVTLTRFLGILFSLYMLLVIRSYYYKMQEETSKILPYRKP